VIEVCRGKWWISAIVVVTLAGFFGIAKFGSGKSIVRSAVAVATSSPSASVKSRVIRSEVSFRWEAVPGIDLQSPEIRAVRAWKESMRILEMRGNAYPGFYGATAPSVLIYDHSVVRGTERMLIYSFEKSETALRIGVCSDSTGMQEYTKTGWRPYWGGLGPFYLIMIRQQDAVTLRAEPSRVVDRSPAVGPAPDQDVFSGWASLGEGGIVRNAEVCENWYKQRTGYSPAEGLERWRKSPGEIVVEPPVPGW
jgi:hypothetical protein